jgi:hypothetical protein
MTGKKLDKKSSFSMRRDLLVSVFLVTSILAVYWQVTDNGFVYDDESYITKNSHVQSGLTCENITWSFTSTSASNWHPLTWLSHLLDYQLYGMNSGMHHLTNLIFHILNTLLLFLVFKRMTGDLWRSSFVAALFALHPLHVESVAWVAERKDVLSSFFWMLTMWGYVLYAERPGINRYMLALLFFILGLMAKPMLVTLPFVLLLLDYWPLNRFRSAKSNSSNKMKQKPNVLHLVLEKIPFIVFASASCVVTFIVQKSGGAVGSLDAYPFKVRAANALVSYVSYTGKMLWPSCLAPIYLHSRIVQGWKIVGASILLISISLLVIRAKRQHPYFVVGWLWYIGTLVPVIGLVQVGLQCMADRYTYIPLTGMFIIIAWGIPILVERWRYRKIVLAVSAGTLLICLMICTWLQVQHWRNSITLFTHTVNVTANNWVAQYNLACGYALENKKEEAIYWLNESIKNGNRKWNLIKTDTDLESIRGSAYYKYLIKGR